ncbi:MAG TPA: transposase, partial [Solirubrobacteraceae bacterium]|nr:transposase [Solirubrobacteraceae bacterium]
VGVPTGNFGPRLQAIVAVCSGAYRMSKRGIEELVEDFFGVPISLGSVANLEQATSKAVEAPVAEVAGAIREEPIVHADETGWFENSKGCGSILCPTEFDRGAGTAAPPRFCTEGTWDFA